MIRAERAERTPIPQGDIQEVLDSHSVPVEEWGLGSAKTLGHLIAEVASGESVLEVGEDGKVYRKIKVVGVDVFFNSFSGRLVLKEDRQVFNDGRQRRRDDLAASITEKVKPKEDVIHAALRALDEELGFKGVVVDYDRNFETKGESTAFPGLTTELQISVFATKIHADQFKEKGYIEAQPDKTSYFIWVPAGS